MALRFLVQPVLCVAGIHESPPPRNPPGPIVATCPCCGRVTYYYGMTAYGILTHYPQLLLPEFPKVLGPISAAYA